MNSNWSKPSLKIGGVSSRSRSATRQRPLSSSGSREPSASRQPPINHQAPGLMACYTPFFSSSADFDPPVYTSPEAIRAAELEDQVQSLRRELSYAMNKSQQMMEDNRGMLQRIQSLETQSALDRERSSSSRGHCAAGCTPDPMPKDYHDCWAEQRRSLDSWTQRTTPRSPSAASCSSRPRSARTQMPNRECGIQTDESATGDEADKTTERQQRATNEEPCQPLREESTNTVAPAPAAAVLPQMDPEFLRFLQDLYRDATECPPVAHDDTQHAPRVHVNMSSEDQLEAKTSEDARRMLLHLFSSWRENERSLQKKIKDLESRLTTVMKDKEEQLEHMEADLQYLNSELEKARKKSTYQAYDQLEAEHRSSQQVVQETVSKLESEISRLQLEARSVAESSESDRALRVAEKVADELQKTVERQKMEISRLETEVQSWQVKCGELSGQIAQREQEERARRPPPTTASTRQRPASYYGTSPRTPQLSARDWEGVVLPGQPLRADPFKRGF